MIFRILEDQYAQKSKEAKAADERFMRLALTLGRRGLGRTWPNPAVGAVVVKDGVIVGRGWTQPGGRPHACLLYTNTSPPDGATSRMPSCG
jgi:diaminohydroxyphosphoribosylaminopyrimidine deaminase/5-amino-6-(5-phosphoribosylamino)uracil reductase